MGLTQCLDEVAGRNRFDVAIVGSGAGGSSLVDRLAQTGTRLLTVESGEQIVDTHVLNLGDNSTRAKFVQVHKEEPWTGDLSDGMLLRMFGGRGVVAGAHLIQFYPEDFRLWDRGEWPEDVIQSLPQLYSDVRTDRRVSTSAISGGAQSFFASILKDFSPHLPTVGVDLATPKGFEVSRGYDSSAARMVRHLLADSVQHPSFEDRRIVAATGGHVVRLLSSGPRVTGLECLDPKRPNGPFQRVHARVYVLAASAIETTRLILNSGMAAERPATGRFLAEHIERRGKILVSFPGDGEAISLVLPPPSSGSLDRYQIHLRGSRVPGTHDFVVDIGGFAAMDPEPRNCVSLSSELDRFGFPRAHTALSPSLDDNSRARRLSDRIIEIARKMDGKFITEQFPQEGFEPQYTDEHRRVQVMPHGRSYHECGTVRMGTSKDDAVTDSSGRVQGIENLYVADAGLFPCVGVANPMLTISALSYMVADAVKHGLGLSTAAAVV